MPGVTAALAAAAAAQRPLTRRGARLGDATVLDSGRPTIVTVGVGTEPVHAGHAATTRDAVMPWAEEETSTP